MIKGYVTKDGSIVSSVAPSELEEWEERLVGTIGELIEFWGFKRNQGRVWALLYLRGEAVTGPALQKLLGLSKGSVSTITRDLEQWGVIHRLRVSGQAAWHFYAETELLAMVSNVLQKREAKLVDKVLANIDDAIESAKDSKFPGDQRLNRLKQMRQLALAMQTLLRVVGHTKTWSDKTLKAMTKVLSRWSKKGVPL